MKAIIFDASTLITFAMNGLIPELRELKKIFKGNFLITKEVQREVVDKPLGIKRFELEALKIDKLLDDKVLELPSVVGVKDNEISIGADEILNVANNTFIGQGQGIKIIHLGEATCLALSKILSKKKVENVLAVDERTTRVLCEKPDNLKKLFGQKLHTKITAREDNYKFFSGFKFIRSAELVYVAHKKGLVRWKKPLILDALLYAVKFKGCSISEDEIRIIKSLK